MKAEFLAVAGFAASVMGHGYVTSFTTDGKSNQGFLRTYNYALKLAHSTPIPA